MWYGWGVCSGGALGIYLGFLFDVLMSEIEVPHELYELLLEEAIEKGISIEEYICKLVEASSKMEK